MKELTNLEVLMEDNCTRKEAEDHLKMGTTVYDGEDFEKNWKSYLDEIPMIDCEEKEEMVEAYKNMIETKKPLPDWGVVEHDGRTYYIEYAI